MCGADEWDPKLTQRLFSLSTVDILERIILCSCLVGCSNYHWSLFTKSQWYSWYLCHSPDQMMSYGGPLLYLTVLCVCCSSKNCVCIST